MARFLIDANLPRYFSLWAGPEFIFVLDLDPTWTDREIWNLASEQGLTIISKDADFSDRVMMSAAGPHVIHLRIGNMKLREFHLFLAGIWDELRGLSAEHRLVQVYLDRIECIE